MNLVVTYTKIGRDLMPANYMLLKSYKVFIKAEAVTSSTAVKEKSNLVIESPVNVRHGSAEY